MLKTFYYHYFVPILESADCVGLSLSKVLKFVPLLILSALPIFLRGRADLKSWMVVSLLCVSFVVLFLWIRDQSSGVWTWSVVWHGPLWNNDDIDLTVLLISYMDELKDCPMDWLIVVSTGFHSVCIAFHIAVLLEVRLTCIVATNAIVKGSSEGPSDPFPANIFLGIKRDPYEFFMGIRVIDWLRVGRVSVHLLPRHQSLFTGCKNKVAPQSDEDQSLLPLPSLSPLVLSPSSQNNAVIPQNI